MSNVIKGTFPGDGGGTGPKEPDLENRVRSLEAKADSIEKRLSSIELLLADIKGQLTQMPKMGDIAVIRVDVARLDGKVSNLPTTWTLIAFAVGSCLASAGLAFAIARQLAR
jgi:hypothetical protein